MVLGAEDFVLLIGADEFVTLVFAEKLLLIVEEEEEVEILHVDEDKLFLVEVSRCAPSRSIGVVFMYLWWVKVDSGGGTVAS